ncbi:MAG TPA: WecB/TagA/CpsF family glycosyltransferase, partial [Pseudomonadales bacterium]
EDETFAKALKNADWLVPDGAGVVLASRILGGEIQGRVTGSDIFYGLNRRMNEKGGMSVFFLGSTQEVLAQICERMAKDYPNVKVAGVYSPPFKPVFSPDDIEQMITAINSAKPDVLWVGMTAPKQERWIYDNLSRLEVTFAAAIGAVFDFYIGRVKRSHPVFQRFGLEWLPRLVQQPRRLWRRMFISAPMFVWHVMRQKIGSLKA